jgi:hypothetical protein
VNDDMRAHFGGSTQFIANVIHTSPKGELASSPATGSMLNTLKDYPAELMSMPGMNKDLITRYVEPSRATTKKHMARVRKNMRSIHSDQPARLKVRQELEDLALIQQVCSVIGNEMFCFVILQDEAENLIYSNITGRVSIKFFTGMHHIIVCYIYKLDTILLRTTKNREDIEMVIDFKSCYDKLNSKGHHPTLHMLNNQCSHAVK